MNTLNVDEETGGKEGMKLFVQTEEFRNLNIALALDEADANPGEECLLYYGEKSTWRSLMFSIFKKKIIDQNLF